MSCNCQTQSPLIPVIEPQPPLFHVVQNLGLDTGKKPFSIEQIENPDAFMHDDFLMAMVRLSPEMVYPHEQIEAMKLQYAQQGLDHHQSELNLFKRCCKLFQSKRPPHALFSQLLLKALMQSHFNGIPFLYKSPGSHTTQLTNAQLKGVQIAEDHAQNLYQIYVSESHASEQILPYAIEMALDSNFRLLYHLIEERNALLANDSQLKDYHNFLFDAWARNPNEGFALNLVHVISYKDQGCDCDIKKTIRQKSEANSKRLVSIFGTSPQPITQHFVLFPLENLDYIIHDFCNRLLI
jgi:hypothetical protein